MHEHVDVVLSPHTQPDELNGCPLAQNILKAQPCFIGISWIAESDFAR